MNPKKSPRKPQNESTPHVEPTDATLKMMLRRGIPITLENYLSMAYMDKNYELSGEEIAGLPDEIRNLLP